MSRRNSSARINVKLVIILILVTVALGISLVAARQVRRTILSKQALIAANAAMENEDWLEARGQLQEYLGRNPDDIEMLKKYAKVCLSIRPVEGPNIWQAIAAYRRVMQLDPLDKDVYGELAKLYSSIRNFEELAYIARMRLEHDPNDREAPLWLTDALMRLNEIADANQVLEKFIKNLEELPEKHSEYVQACIRMSGVILADTQDASEALKDASEALEWLNKAVTYMPDSVEALTQRARFYRIVSGISGLSDQERLERAREDLEAAEKVGTEDPRIRYALGLEWLSQGELDRAAANIEDFENLPQEAIEEYFIDVNDWTVQKYFYAFEVAHQQRDTTKAASLADAALKDLTEEKHRARILPSVVRIYIDASRVDPNRVEDARKYLDEYLAIQDTYGGTAQDRQGIAYIQALVANAENKPYTVIDILQPFTDGGNATPEQQRLLAWAYHQTSQTNRAVDVLTPYLRGRPNDFEMIRLLAMEYFRLRDWNKAFETAQIAESLNSTDIAARLFRIEAGIHLAAESSDKKDTAKLKALSTELVALREEHPDRDDIGRLLAVINSYLGQMDETEKELKQVIEKSAEPLDAEMQLVKYYRQEGQITKAIEECQKVCDRHPGVAQPRILLSELHMANKDYEAACRTLEQGLSDVVDEPQKRSLSMALALLKLLHGDRSTGIHLLEQLAEDKKEIRARSLLLDIPEVRKDPTRTAELLEELKKAEGENGLFWRFHEASLWLSSGEWRLKQQDITERLQYCMTANPLWLSPVLLLMNMYEKLGDFERIEDLCRQTLARNPSATAVADRLLRLLERQGRYSEAEQVLKNFQDIKADTRLTDAWQVRMAVHSGDMPQAIQELETRIKNDDQDANSRIQLAGLLYQETKDANEALGYLKEAEAITPDSQILTMVKVSILKADGQTEEARRVLDTYVADHNDFSAYWMRAFYLAEEGEFERAEQGYKKLTTFVDLGAAGYELLGNFYAGNNKLDRAVITLEEGLNVYPENLGLKRRLMETLFTRANAQDQERALEILTDLEKRMPEDLGLIKIRVMQILREPTSQSLKAAREKLETAVKLAPTAVDMHLALINIAMQQREFETARDFAIRALGSNPKNSALLSARSKTELELGNTQMAVQLAQQALKEDSSNVIAMVTLADTYRLNGDMDQSKEWIGQAERLDPNNLAVFGARCLWLESNKQFGELVKIGSTFLSTKERNVRKVLMVASFLSASDSVEFRKEGIKLFEHALTLSPASLEAGWGLASTLYGTGDIDRAKNVYQKMLEQYPDNIRLLNDLAWIFQEHDHRYEAALELADRGLSLAPNDLHLLDTRGTILSNIADRLVDARKDFEKLLELSSSDNPRQAKTLLKLGRICAQLNDFVSAKQHLEKALEIDQKINIFSTEERSEITKIIRESGR